MLKAFLSLFVGAGAVVLTAAPSTADLSLCISGLCAIDGIEPGTVLARVPVADVSGGVSFTVTASNPGWLLWDGGLFGFNAPAGPTKGGLEARGSTHVTFSVTGLQTPRILENDHWHRFAAHIGVPNAAYSGRPCEAVTGFATEMPTGTPEPGTFILLGCSLIGLGWLGTRLRRGRRM